MTSNDRDKFVHILTQLHACMREHDALDEAAFEGYWLALCDLPLTALKKAATLAARTSKFMPKAAELRELAGDMSLANRAVLAFDQVNRAISTIGAYKSIDFDDPAINAAIRAMGGWPELCSTTQEDFHSFKAAQFEKYYKAFATAGCTAEQGAYLIGYYERDNRLHGYDVEPAVKLATGLPPLSTAQRIARPDKPGAIEQNLPKLELQRP